MPGSLAFLVVCTRLPCVLNRGLDAHARRGLQRTTSVCLCVQVRKGLAHLDPYFEKLADGMIAW